MLDIGPADGFFSFEFERRGASEVVSVDMDPGAFKQRFPQSKGGHQERMRFVRDLLRSDVKIRYGDIYDLSGSGLGLFDFVFCGDVFLHVTDPVRALRNIRAVTRGRVVIATVYAKEPFLQLYETVSGSVFRSFGSKSRPSCAFFVGSDVYWIPTRRGLLSIMETAGFRSVKVVSTFRMSRPGKRSSKPEIVVHAAP